MTFFVTVIDDHFYIFPFHRSFSSHSRSESTDSLGVKKRYSALDMDASGSPMIDLCLGRKLYEFYRAPITKFWGNVVSILLWSSLNMNRKKMNILILFLRANLRLQRRRSKNKQQQGRGTLLYVPITSRMRL